MSINKLTGFAVVTAADGKRVSYNWTELDEDGNTISKNNLASFTVMDDSITSAISTIEEFIKLRIK